MGSLMPETPLQRKSTRQRKAINLGHREQADAILKRMEKTEKNVEQRWKRLSSTGNTTESGCPDCSPKSPSPETTTKLVAEHDLDCDMDFDNSIQADPPGGTETISPISVEVPNAQSESVVDTAPAPPKNRNRTGDSEKLHIRWGELLSSLHDHLIAFDNEASGKPLVSEKAFVTLCNADCML